MVLPFSTLSKGKDFDIRKGIRKIDFTELLDHFVQIQRAHSEKSKNEKRKKLLRDYANDPLSTL